MKRYNARTYVEGAFGNMKNPTTENVERGFFQVTGLAKVSFMVGIALAHNLRMLRGNILLFAAGGGDMLLQEDAECHGFMFITPDEEELLATHRASPMTQVGMDTESRLAGHATQESVIGQLRASCDLSL